MSCAVLERLAPQRLQRERSRALSPSANGNCLSLRTGELPVEIALRACFPPKLHAPRGSGLPGLLCDSLETTRCRGPLKCNDTVE
jgi:hypothetical protein